MGWGSEFKTGVVILTFMCITPVWADYEAGQQAWEAGLQDVAIAEWRASANAGEAKAMQALGRLYLRGAGVPQNYVQAHKWFNLAASRGEATAAVERDALVARMTPQERAEAQKLALEWRPGQAPARADYSAAASAEAIREVQNLLSTLGYQPGAADGMWGERTARSLQAFWRDSGQSRPTTLTEALRILRAAAQRPAASRAAAQRPVVQRTANKPFRDCSMCPEVIVVPAGSFLRGSPVSEEGRKEAEGPQQEVSITHPLAVGVYEVTFAEWDACVQAGGCNGHRPDDEGWTRARQPVINVSWADAQAYVSWLAEETGRPYRLLSEAEWEYVTRAGTQTPFYTGETITPHQANYYSKYSYAGGRIGEYRERPVPVGSFEPNAFGLYDTHGNVWEWVQDCWKADYVGAPTDEQAQETENCSHRVARGGSWYYAPSILRSASRERYVTDFRNNSGGFRIARALTPEPQQAESPPAAPQPAEQAERPPTASQQEQAESPPAAPQPPEPPAERAERPPAAPQQEQAESPPAAPQPAEQAERPPAAPQQEQAESPPAAPQPAEQAERPPAAPQQEQAESPPAAPQQEQAESPPAEPQPAEPPPEQAERPPAEPQPFTVKAEPSGARVRVVNIEERYQAGMALGPGAYEVEVSAPGYETARETVRHGAEPTERQIALVRAPQPPRPSGLQQEAGAPYNPVLLVQVSPTYPRRAARLQIEGSVIVEFTVTPDGSVVEPVVIEAKPARIFDQAALDAVVQWKFKPRMRNGQAVESRVRQQIDFDL